MREVLFVLLEDYADWETALVAAAVNDNEEDGGNCKVKTVSLSKDPVHSIGGFTTLPDYSLSSVPEDFAAVILIGGRSWRKESATPVADLVKRAIEKKVPVGGICDGSVFLGMHGFLNNVRHTSNTLESLKKGAKENYTNEKNYIAQQAVSDGGIITANGSAYMEFAKEVLQALNFRQAKVDEFYDYYKLGQYEAYKKWGRAL